MSTDRDTNPGREDPPLRRGDVELLLGMMGGSENLDARGLNLKGIDQFIDPRINRYTKVA